MKTDNNGTIQNLSQEEAVKLCNSSKECIGFSINKDLAKFYKGKSDDFTLPTFVIAPNVSSLFKRLPFNMLDFKYDNTKLNDQIAALTKDTQNVVVKFNVDVLNKYSDDLKNTLVQHKDLNDNQLDNLLHTYCEKVVKYIDIY